MMKKFFVFIFTCLIMLTACVAVAQHLMKNSSRQPILLKLLKMLALKQKKNHLLLNKKSLEI